MPTSESQKLAIKKWRENNLQHYREITLRHVHTSRAKWYDYNNEVKKFRKILFDGFISVQ